MPLYHAEEIAIALSTVGTSAPAVLPKAPVPSTGKEAWCVRPRTSISVTVTTNADEGMLSRLKAVAPRSPCTCDDAQKSCVAVGLRHEVACAAGAARRQTIYR